MKLDFQNVVVEKSAAFQSQHFDIGNKRIILEILRGKMYSNPIQTICQEYMSNARDAHREAGKENVPIVVKLPNKLEPAFYIQDFGLSITPTRMATVFIRYGESTKRDDNTQTGGWGLGAKSGFSYTDSFSVVCITEENGVRTKRQYIAHLDPSGLGQMTCVSEEVTTEETGTTIIITPKEGDFNLFREQILRAGYFWNPRPKILGDRSWQWPEIKVEYKGQDWEIHKYEPSASNILPAPYALIDGIPYPIKTEHLFKASKPAFSGYRSTALRLFFKVGEIPITANREEIDYQEKSIALLESRINAAFTELTQILTKSIVEAPTLTKAISAWQSAKRHPQFGSLCSHSSWSPPSDPKQIIPLTNELSLKDLFCNVYWKAQNEFGFTRSPDRAKSISIDDSVRIMEDDSPTATVSRQRLANAFASHPEMKRLYLISFYRKTIVEKVTDPAGVVTNKNKIIAVEDDYPINKKIAEITLHWNHLDKLKLSDYEKKKIDVPKAASGPKALEIRYFDEGNHLIKKSVFEEVLKDTSMKYYIVASGNNFTLPGSEKAISYRELTDSLNQIGWLTGTKVRLYLVTTRHSALLDNNWTPLPKLIETSVLAEAAKSGGVIYNRRRSGPSSYFHEAFIRAFSKKTSEIKDQTSLPVTFFKSGAQASSDTHTYAAALAKSFDINVKLEGSDPFESMYNKLREQYPLLCGNNFHYSDNMSAIVADLISYVNMKNEELKKGKTTP